MSRNCARSINVRTLHIKIRTKKDDAEHVRLVWGDPYEYTGGTWKANELAMAKIAATSTHDYWFAEVAPPFRRLQYGFILTGADDRDTFYGSNRCTEALYILFFFKQKTAYEI